VPGDCALEGKAGALLGGPQSLKPVYSNRILVDLLQRATDAQNGNRCHFGLDALPVSGELHVEPSGKTSRPYLCQMATTASSLMAQTFSSLRACATILQPLGRSRFEARSRVGLSPNFQQTSTTIATMAMSRREHWPLHRLQ
jgi:hypothetical protein